MQSYLHQVGKYALHAYVRTCTILLLLLAANLKMQAQCLTNITAANTEVAMFNGSTTCILGSTICLTSTQNAELARSVDGDINSYTEWSNLVSVLGGSQGISLKAVPGNNYNNKVVGILLSTGGGILDLNLLGSLSFSLLNNGVVVSTQTYSNLISTGGILNGGTSSIVYFPNSSQLSFNEIRIFKNSGLISALDVIRLHEVVLLDPDCPGENNNICRDFIQGTGTVITSTTGILNALGGISNLDNLNNGNSNDFITMGFVVNALTTHSVGVTDLLNLYNKTGSTRVGVVVEPSAAGLLNLDALGNLNVRIVTYLYGVKQDSSAVINQGSGNSLLALSALTSNFGNQAANKQMLSFITTKPFNEVRLQFLPTVNLQTAPPLKLYGFFEEPLSCGDCINKLKTPAANSSAPIKGTIRTGSSWTSGAPVLGLLAGINNTDRVVDANEDNYASVGGLLAALSTLRVTVELDSLVAAGTFAGYELSNGGALLNLSLLGNITIRTFNGTTEQEAFSAAQLAGLSLINGGSSQTSLVGFMATKPFNAVMIESFVSLSVLPNLRIHNLAIITDQDNDGTPDCIDAYPNCDNSIDADNNGIPDACDITDITSVVELLSNVTSFRAGDTLLYKATLTNTGTTIASNIQFTFNQPVAGTVLKWQKVTSSPTSALDTFNGTGNISETIPFIFSGYKVEYYVTVVMAPNTNVPFAISSIEVNKPFCTVTTACAQCRTAPLPRVDFPDLMLATESLNTKLNSTTQVDMDLVIKELNNVTTEKEVWILIPKSNNAYTVSLNTGRNTTIIPHPGETTDHANWTLDNVSNSLFYILKSNANYFIEGNSTKYIPLTLTKAGTSTNYELKNITFTINNNRSGGDITPANNVTVLYILYNVQ